MNLYRIAKFIARCGLCSRRKAANYIVEGRVQVNGQQMMDLSRQVSNDDEVKIDGQVIHIHDTELWIYYKPVNVITSSVAHGKDKIVYNNLPPELQNFRYVGRLDKMSEGLLLLTNNGDLSDYLSRPTNQIIRKYKVFVYGKVDVEYMHHILSSQPIYENHYRGVTIKHKWKKDNNHLLEFILTEGKNREIRNICAYFDLKIKKLIRIQYHEFLLNDMNPNDTQKVPHHILVPLLKNL